MQTILKQSDETTKELLETVPFACCVPGMAHVLEVETYLQPRVVTPKA